MIYSIFYTGVQHIKDNMRKGFFNMALQMEGLGSNQRLGNSASIESQKLGLTPWVGETPTVLILGTLPSDDSIKSGAYYQNPRNRFWEIVHHLLGGSVNDKSKEFLFMHNIALWDCLKSAQRKGSTDKKIVKGTEIPNDLNGFLNEHPTIRYIVLNGTSKTQSYFRKFHKELYKDYEVKALPQTSRLNESGRHKISFDEKLLKWSVLKDLVNA